MATTVLKKLLGNLFAGPGDGSMLGYWSQTLANNQVSAADITGFLVDKTKHRSFVAEYSIRRWNGSADTVSQGVLRGIYRSYLDVWELGGETIAGDVVGVTFSITTAGQVQYTSTNTAFTDADINFSIARL